SRSFVILNERNDSTRSTVMASGSNNACHNLHKADSQSFLRVFFRRIKVRDAMQARQCLAREHEKGATLRGVLFADQRLYLFAGTQAVLSRSYFRPGADFNSSFVVFIVSRFLLSLEVILTAVKGTATSFSPAPRNPPTPMMSALIWPDSDTSTSSILPIELFD